MKKRLTRAEVDKVAWKTIKAKPVNPILTRNRPNNYKEIGERLRAGGDMELIWGDFLHSFYAHRQPSLFEYRRPPS
jgi:hypothetical protein